MIERILIFFLASLFIASAAWGQQLAPPKERPNILMIVADDMNWDTPGCFDGGFVGPNDMTVNMGIPNQYDHEDFIAILQRIIWTSWPARGDAFQKRDLGIVCESQARLRYHYTN